MTNDARLESRLADLRRIKERAQKILKEARTTRDHDVECEAEVLLAEADLAFSAAAGDRS